MLWYSIDLAVIFLVNNYSKACTSILRMPLLILKFLMRTTEMNHPNRQDFRFDRIIFFHPTCTNYFHFWVHDEGSGIKIFAHRWKLPLAAEAPTLHTERFSTMIGQNFSLTITREMPRHVNIIGWFVQTKPECKIWSNINKLSRTRWGKSNQEEVSFIKNKIRIQLLPSVYRKCGW